MIPRKNNNNSFSLWILKDLSSVTRWQWAECEIDGNQSRDRISVYVIALKPCNSRNTWCYRLRIRSNFQLFPTQLSLLAIKVELYAQKKCVQLISTWLNSTKAIFWWLSCPNDLNTSYLIARNHKISENHKTGMTHDQEAKKKNNEYSLVSWAQAHSLCS